MVLREMKKHKKPDFDTVTRIAIIIIVMIAFPISVFTNSIPLAIMAGTLWIGWSIDIKDLNATLNVRAETVIVTNKEETHEQT